ncbi:MAG: RimK/LysX family protein [Candidatus Saccharibacteria bacterium]|nr:RimK/LysX family protein [Candidatus Saccharibacteria bacterium]
MNDNMPVLGFFREKNDTEEFKFKSPSYQQAYQELIELLNECGIYVAILMGQNSYVGHGKFSKHWVQVKRDGQYVFEKRGEIKPDIVWVKDLFLADDVLQLNSPAFRDIAADKHKTYELLSEFQPKSSVVYDYEQLTQAISETSGEMIVIKTLTGNSGLGVFVGRKTDFDYNQFAKEFPLQVQEYIETNIGIDGIVDDRHDFRVVIINGQPIIATLRTPPEGGLKSNIGYGGMTRLLDVEQIPFDLKQIVAKIDQKLTAISQDRFYSADFGMTANGWRLFEINSMPGTINRDRGDPAIKYQQRLVEFLADLTRRSMMDTIKPQIIGRAERVDLIDYNLQNLPAKIDTGAYSSSIDHSLAEVIEEDGQQKLQFILLRPGRVGYTGQKNITDNFEVTEVKNSNGSEKRYVIFSRIKINGFVKKCRLTLADRGQLRYPVLIGRRFLREANVLVDVNKGQGLPDDEEERKI